MKKVLLKTISLILAGIMAISLSACDPNGSWLKSDGDIAFTDGSSYITIQYALLGKNRNKARLELKEALRDYNACMNPSLTTSDIYKFNNSKVDSPVEVSKLTYDAVALAKHYYDMTEFTVELNGNEVTANAFNPAVFPLVELWNLRSPYTMHGTYDYDAVVEGLGRTIMPAIGEVEELLSVCTFDNISFYSEGGKYYLNKLNDERVQIELGAMLKGMAVDTIRDILEANKIISASINISGNVYVYKGIGAEQADWRVNVTNPKGTDFDKYLLSVNAKDTSFVSSGDYNLYYVLNYGGSSVMCTHIINPATGMPINVAYDNESGRYFQTAGLSETVIMGASSAACDAFSTAAIVMGMDKAIDFLSGQAGYAGILVSDFNTKEMAVIGDFKLADESPQTYKQYNLVYGEFN